MGQWAASAITARASRACRPKATSPCSSAQTIVAKWPTADDASRRTMSRSLSNLP